MQATMNSAIASGIAVPKSSNVSQQKACVLDGARLDLNLLREDNRLELLEILDSIPSSQKCLVLDPQLGGRLNHVLVEGARVLRENGVSSFRELKSFGDEFDPDTTYVYACRATVPHVQAIAKQIKAAIRQDHKNHFHVLLLPKRTFLCEHFLRDVENYVTVHDFRLDLVAFDKDVLSLEWDSCYHENKIAEDPTSLEFVTQSLLKLENFFGQPSRIRGLGHMAKGVLERLAKQRFKIHALKLKDRGYFGNSPLFGSKPPPPLPDEDRDRRSPPWELLVLDREVDLVTPLVTPLTYEGLIDELMGGVKNSSIKLDKETAPLNSNEKMYAEIRDLNVEGLGSRLGNRAKEIRGIYDQFRSNQSLTEIHDFVKKIPDLTRDYKALQTHIDVVEKLKKTTDSRQFRERWNTERSMLEGELIYDNLEDLIAQQIPPMLALRFVSMQSLTGGIKANKFDAIKKLIVHSYGFELLPTLHNLEKANLFKKKADAPLSMMLNETPFALLRKQLALIVDDVDPVNPRDVAYVSSGYAPLSVRLVERPEWSPQLLANLPGPALDYRPADYDRKRLVDMMKAPTPPYFPSNAGNNYHATSPEEKTPLVIYIVGGVTYAEIAAFRFLSKKKDFPYDIIVASTNITNGTAFVKSLVYEIDNKLQKKSS